MSTVECLCVEVLSSRGHRPAARPLEPRALASPGGGPAITRFPLGLPKAPGVCLQAQDTGHLLSPSGSGSPTASGCEAVLGQPPLTVTFCLSLFADV